MTKKYALLTVSDKRGLKKFASGLSFYGYSIVASEGTSKFLRAKKIDVIDVQNYTGQRPVMQPQGIKLIHPKIFGGILANLNIPQHRQDLSEFDIYPFDIVACNFYPFEKNPKITNIDIGGPAMVRCAAKNYERVTVIVDPKDYSLVLDEIKQHGNTTRNTRHKLAVKAFQKSAKYDQAIIDWLNLLYNNLTSDTKNS